MTKLMQNQLFIDGGVACLRDWCLGNDDREFALGVRESRQQLNSGTDQGLLMELCQFPKNEYRLFNQISEVLKGLSNAMWCFEEHHGDLFLESLTLRKP
jgi:hypothetical protein